VRALGIRLAQAADRAALEAIVQAAYEPWVPVIGVRPLPMVADYGRIIADEQAYVLENGEYVSVAREASDGTRLAGEEANNQIDGLIVLVAEDGTLLVENVAVRPERQGRGLGRRLLAFAEFRARTLGLAALRLYTNEKMTANIALYESLGYRETSREDVDGRQVVHLRKDL
jgi:GNAT superfamily N-acetyltransferase